jgi:hypothetical protein
MDDRRSHFLTMVGDLCSGAGVAGLEVELLLGDGQRVCGIPTVATADRSAQPVNDTGYGSPVSIDGRQIALEEIQGLSVSSPS